MAVATKATSLRTGGWNKKPRLVGMAVGTKSQERGDAQNEPTPEETLESDVI
jgi:hypothetical protein